MEITNKYIIEVFGFDERMWWNGSKPFVNDINKAFICPHKKSAETNKEHLDDFYGCDCRIVPLKIVTEE
jgi:hypothetical protein